MCDGWGTQAMDLQGNGPLADLLSLTRVGNLALYVVLSGSPTAANQWR